MAYRASFGGAGFNVRITDPIGQVEGWRDTPNIIVTPIPGSSPPITEVEIVWPQGPSQATWRVSFDSTTDLQLVRAKIGVIDTLVVPSRIQAHSGSEVGGQTYLPHTLLLALGPPAAHIDGSVECEMTVLRQLDPATGEAIAMSI